MERFYDPKDEQELAAVERALHDAGIEYFLVDEPAPKLGPKQIQVAEEDLPSAEAVIREFQQRQRAESSGAKRDN